MINSPYATPNSIPPSLPPRYPVPVPHTKASSELGKISCEGWLRGSRSSGRGGGQYSGRASTPRGHGRHSGYGTVLGRNRHNEDSSLIPVPRFLLMDLASSGSYDELSINSVNSSKNLLLFLPKSQQVYSYYPMGNLGNSACVASQLYSP